MTASDSEIDHDYLKKRCSEYLVGFIKKLENEQITWYGYEVRDVEERRLALIGIKVYVEDCFDQYLGLQGQAAAAVCQPYGSLQLVVMFYCQKKTTRRSRAAEKDVIIRKNVIAFEAKKPNFFCPRPKLPLILEKALQKTFRTQSIHRLGMQGNHLPSLTEMVANAATGGKLSHYPDKEEAPQTLTMSSKSDFLTGHVHVADASEKRDKETLLSKLQSDAVLKVDHLRIKTRNPIDFQNGDAREDTSEKELIISTPDMITHAQNLITEDLVVKPIPAYLTSFIARGKTNTKFK